MINGDPREFLETVYNGEDIIYRYNGIRYFYQGYTKEDGLHMEVLKYDAVDEGLILDEVSHFSNTIEIFENAPIFEGKTFWQAEKDMEWLDGYTE